jgi:hypothetical protein
MAARLGQPCCGHGREGAVGILVRLPGHPAVEPGATRPTVPWATCPKRCRHKGADNRGVHVGTFEIKITREKRRLKRSVPLVDLKETLFSTHTLSAPSAPVGTCCEISRRPPR